MRSEPGAQSRGLPQSLRESQNLLNPEDSTKKRVNGAELDMGRFSEIHLAAEHSVKISAIARIAPDKVARSRTKFNFVINSVDSKIKQKVSQQNVFYVPEKQLIPK